MHAYDGEVYRQQNGKFLAVVFRVSGHSDEPNYDTIAEKEVASRTKGFNWINNEISSLYSHHATVS